MQMRAVSNKAIQLDPEELQQTVQDICADLDAARADGKHALDEIKDFREYNQTRRPRRHNSWQGAIEIDPRYVTQTVLALQAEINPALLYTQPLARYYTAGNSPIGDMSEEWERFQQVLLHRETPFVQRMKGAYLRACVDSTCIMQTTWETRYGWVEGWDVQQDEQGQITSVKERRAVDCVYDYPRFDVIPIDYFTVFPAFDADIQESPGVAAITPGITGSRLLQLVEQGAYDKDAVESVLSFAQGASTKRNPDDKQRRVGSNNPEVMRQRLTVDLTEAYFLMPPKGGKGPEERWKFVIHEDSQTCLQARPNPWWHGRVPYAVCRPYPDASGIYGYSVASLGGAYIQDAKRALWTYSLQAMEIGIKPPMVTSMNSYKKLYDALVKNYRPGGLIGIEDDVWRNQGANAMRFLVSQGYTPSQAMQMLQMFEVEAQKVFPSAGLGAQMSNDPSATEARQVASGANALEREVIQNCAEFQSAVHRDVHDLIRQFQGNPLVRDLWAEINGDVPIELASRRRYYIDANGLAESNDEQTRALQGEIMLKMGSADPAVMSDPQKIYALKHYYVRRHRIPSREFEAIFGTPDEYGQAAAQAAESAPPVLALKQKQAEERGRNMRQAAMEETKRENVRLKAVADLLKLGLTQPLPEEQIEAQMALEQASAPEQEGAPAGAGAGGPITPSAGLPLAGGNH